MQTHQIIKPLELLLNIYKERQLNNYNNIPTIILFAVQANGETGSSGNLTFSGAPFSI